MIPPQANPTFGDQHVAPGWQHVRCKGVETHADRMVPRGLGEAATKRFHRRVPRCGRGLPVPVGYGRVLSAVASAAVPARRGIRARRHRREALSAVAARGQRRQCGVAPRPAVRTERPGCRGGRSASRGGDRVAAPHLRRGQQRADAQGRSWSSSRALCRVGDPRSIGKDGTSLALARVAGMPGTNIESGV